MKIYTTLPDGKCECPVCQGTGRKPVPASAQQYKRVTAGYRADDDTFPCSNCGGQTMYGKPLGYVNAMSNGVGCTHTYLGTNSGRCRTVYRCIHCKHTYEIDSGD